MHVKDYVILQIVKSFFVQYSLLRKLTEKRTKIFKPLSNIDSDVSRQIYCTLCTQTEDSRSAYYKNIRCTLEYATYLIISISWMLR